MNGVEILAVENVATAYAFNWTAFWAGFFAILVIVVLYLFLSGTFRDILKCNLVTLVLIIIIVGALIAGVMLGIIWMTPTEYETQYKVTADDSVSIVDFYDRYEVLDQEGKIYTVVERTMEE